jgi:hypothetical protein
MTSPEAEKILKRIDEISRRVDNVEEMVSWAFTAEQRGLAVGQRVRFTERAFRRGVAGRRKATAGEITAVNGFSIRVKLDGYKTASSFHHSFFQPEENDQ